MPPLALREWIAGVVAKPSRGQRCTSTRRLFLHRDISAQFLSRLMGIYDSSKLPAGDPLNPSTLIGPLHNPAAVDIYMKTLDNIKSRGGEVLTKRQGKMDVEDSGGNYVWPIVVRPRKDDPSWQEETFAPILQVAEFDTLDEAIQ